MRTLYLDCTKGVSGDMLISSLLCHLKDAGSFVNAMTSICVVLSARLDIADKVIYSFAGKAFEVHCEGVQQLRHLEEILSVIESAKLPDNVKNKAADVFQRLAMVEAQVHGIPVSKVHFHEIGAADTIIDIVGFFVLLDLLGVDNIVTSPVNVGSGTVCCEHGVLPVPAPATAELLLGNEIFADDGENGERATPTGAALVSVGEQGDMPCGKLISTGVGFGKKYFKNGNYLRSFLLDSKEQYSEEYIYLLECNIDDMTPEALGFAVEVLLNEGALDVWQQPVYMKKNRLGTKLSVLCRDKDKFSAIIFKHTTTLGIRVNKIKRVLRGKTEFTKKNGIRIKCTGNIQKPEYEDLRREAIKNNVSLAEIAESMK